MDVLVLLVLLVALGLLANRYGADSRPRPRSHEEHLAALGHAWGELRPGAPAAASGPEQARVPGGPRGGEVVLGGADLG